jgi:hypothetical protein
MLEVDDSRRWLAELVALSVRQVACGAHFFVRGGRIVWAREYRALSYAVSRATVESVKLRPRNQPEDYGQTQ